MAGEEKKDELLGLDEEDGNEELVLVSQDGPKFTCNKKVALMSELVKTMAEGDKDEREIPLPNVKSTVLEKVTQYMKYHVDNPAKEIEKPLKSANMNEVVAGWDADFVDVDQDLLFELILAANYMDIKSLLDLTCAKVASMKKVDNVEEGIGSLDDGIGGLDDEDDSGTIKLTSKDGPNKKAVDIEKKHAFISVLVKTSIENDQAATEVPLPGVEGPILEEVIRYMQHHKGVEPPIVEKPLRSKVMKEVCQDVWDAEYIDTIGEDRQKLYDVILAANYMDIKSLLHLGCAKVASLIKGKPLEQIKDILATNKQKGEEKKDSGT